jgi:hypothetical protein
MPGPTAIWQASGPTLTRTVLPAYGRPTWIFWPPIVMAPVHCLASYPEPFRYLSDRSAVQDLNR